MTCRRIADGDTLFRHSIHPVSFKGRVFVWEKCLHLVDRPDGFLGSLAWERYLPTSELIHEYGCRLALRRNQKKRAEGRYKDKDRQIYCGAYQLRRRAIRNLGSADGLDEILYADAVHRIEEGEIAHTDLLIVLRPVENLHPEGTKTAILDRLWNASSGPLRHTCDYDQDIPEHPKLRLATAPAGPYSDTRSNLFRLWCFLRYHICKWVLRKLARG
jgi:hypothetical protein